MKRLILIAALALSLGGCAQLAKIQSAYQVVTNTTISPKAVYIARNTFDALEQTATNYIVQCNALPGPLCSKQAIQQIIPLVRSGRVTRNQLTAYVKAHPDAIGSEGLYDALNYTIDTIKQIGAKYQIKGLQ
jgi:hypothetical protein